MPEEVPTFWLITILAKIQFMKPEAIVGLTVTFVFTVLPLLLVLFFLPKRIVAFLPGAGTKFPAAGKGEAAIVLLPVVPGEVNNKDSPTRRTKIFFHAFGPGPKAEEVAILGAWVVGGPVSVTGSWHR